LDVPDPQLLVDAIGDREMVIVLDNCEHVIDAAAAAAEGLLRHCSGVRLVATSREALPHPGRDGVGGALSRGWGRGPAVRRALGLQERRWS
jgi:hypothetical protein